MSLPPLGRSTSAYRNRGRGAATVVGRGGRDTDAGPRARALQTPLREGQTRCPTCGRGVGSRADGSMRAHQAVTGIPCAAVAGTIGGSTSDLCEHGNYRSQRAVCCGTTPTRKAQPVTQPMTPYQQMLAAKAVGETPVPQGRPPLTEYQREQRKFVETIAARRANAVLQAEYAERFREIIAAERGALRAAIDAENAAETPRTLAELIKEVLV